MNRTINTPTLKTQDVSTLTRSSRTALVAGFLALAGFGLVSTAASAQDYAGGVAAGMARMDQIIRQGNQQVNGIINQRMHDPRVQSDYRLYQQQMFSQGRAPMNFQQYTYEWVRNAGFTSGGKAYAAAVESSNQARVMGSWRDLQAAQAGSTAAIQGWNNGFSRNSNEFGNQLMGNSTFHQANGMQQVLPHTWQANTWHNHLGNQYRVDASGQYHVLGNNGYWYPLSR